MSVEFLSTFLATALALIITPGPSKLLLFSLSASQGFRAGIRLALGVYISDILLVMAVAIGLGAAIMAMPEMYEAIALIGAAFLLYFASKFGMNALRGPTITGFRKKIPQSGLLSMGLFINIFNPIALTFYIALLPGLAISSGFPVNFTSVSIVGLSLVTFFFAAHLAIAFIATIVGARNVSSVWYRITNSVVCAVLFWLSVKLITSVWRLAA